MSKALRKLIGTANKGNCTIMFINQLRQKARMGEAWVAGRGKQGYGT
jgi:RecA/RadA recombinase